MFNFLWWIMKKFSWSSKMSGQSRWWTKISSLLCWIMKISLREMTSQLTKSMVFQLYLLLSSHLTPLTKDYLGGVEDL